jgi:hypothetical protein
MKKVFFVFAVAAGIAMTACNNKPAESTDAAKTDTTSVTTTVNATTDTTAKPMAADTTAKMDSSSTTKK